MLIKLTSNVQGMKKSKYETNIEFKTNKLNVTLHRKFKLLT